MIDQSTQKISEASGPTEEQKSSAIWIGALAFITLVIIALISYRIASQSEGGSYIGFYFALAFALVALASLTLSIRGSVYLGSGILVGSIWLVTLVLPYFAAGQVTAPAIASLLVASAVASATLPSAWSFRAGVVSIALSISVIIADLFLPITFGIHSRQIAAVPLSVALAALYAYFILRRFSFYTLRIKLLITFILVTIIPLAILGFYNNLVARNNLTQQGDAELQNLANLTATQLDAFVRNQLDSTRIEAQQPELAAYLEMSSFVRHDSAEEKGAAHTLASFVRQDPLFIESYALLDAQGVNVLDTVDVNIGRKEGGDDYFARVMKTGEVQVSNLIFRDDTPDIIFSAPVRNESGVIIGVLRSEYHAGALQALINSVAGSTQAGHTLALLDDTYFIRLAFSGNRDELYKSYRNFTDANLRSLQAIGALPPGSLEDVLTPSEDMLWGLENIQQVPFFTMYSPSLNDSAVVTAAPLKNIGWMVVASRSESSLFSPVRDQTRGIVLISLFLIIAAALSSLAASQVLMAPITALTEVAERISSGYLTARAQASTRDEIGSLATAFNNMTMQLRQAVTNLEARVRERTTDVENARQQSEKRAQNLEAISDVARAISAEQKLDTLLPLVTQLVSEKFDFYHTGIFFLDEKQEYAVLRAANSEGGQRMLERGHRLQVGQTGIVGYVAHSGKARIALDVGEDAVFFNNPDLPETRSELALPLSLRGKTIGVLDVQSKRSGAFTQDDINTLSIMADQVAVAIENARLFGQNQETLEQVQSLYSQYLRQEWEAFTRQENKFGYEHTMAGGRVLDRPVETDAIREALAHGRVQVMDGDENGRTPSVAIPLMLRGEIIGVLNVASPQKSRQWGQDEIDLAQAVADRLALALENARLLQDSLRRAAKEQKIGQITTRIGATINMRNMLQTAVEELGRALPGSDVVIQFHKQTEAAGSNGNRKIQ